MSYVTARLAALRAPLAGPNGRAWSRALGSAQDDEAPLLRIAGVCRSVTKAPDDALSPVLGSAYMRPRAPTPEARDDDAYRARLGAAAWAHWETAPRKTGGMTTLFSPYGGEVQCFSNSDAAFDSNTGWCSRVFWIWDNDGTGFLQMDAAWDDTVDYWDDGGGWDLYYDASIPAGFGVPDLDYLRRDIRRSKGSQAYPVLIGVGLFMYDDGGPFWDSVGGNPVWDEPAAPDWDGTVDGDYTFLPLGHVWEEESQFYGGGPGTWDSSPEDVWDDFYPPSGGW